MVDAPLEMVACPPHLVREALVLALSDLAPEARQEVVRGVSGLDSAERSIDGLFVALWGDQLRGAVWAQRQPGNTAIFWPPQWTGAWNSVERRSESLQLAASAALDMDRSAIAMAQALLPSRQSPVVPVLEGVGFRYLADLLYLSCERASFPSEPPDCGPLEFQSYDPAQRDRLAQLVEQTYEGTHDCIGLNGLREMGDVIDGYAMTGTSETSQWYFVRSNGRDVGVLVGAEHSGPRHWELVYMGLVPAARGKRWGLTITRWIEWLAQRADAERIVLAVDAGNRPALAMYREAGFSSWDQRTVFARFGAAHGA